MSILIPSLRSTVAVPSWAKNELWRRARAVPSLDQRFAESKSLVDAVSGQQLITFTRESDGTFVDSAGVIQTAAANVPRFDHNPVTGESLGLLVEEQRTNLLLRSEEFNTTWPTGAGSGNFVVTANDAIAPNGSLTADRATDTVDGSNQAHQTSQGVALVSGLAYTASIYAKLDTAGGLTLGFAGSGAFSTEQRASFNLVNQTSAIQLGTPTNLSIVAVGGGWYRVSASFTATASGTGLLVIRILNSSQSGFYQGTGSQSLFVWGAQLEAGAFPTSYIPTTATAVTRSADVASITGDNFSRWFVSSGENTFLAEYPQPALITGTLIEGSGAGDALVGLTMNIESVGRPRATVRHGDSRLDSVQSLPPYRSGRNMLAAATSASGSAVASNGTLFEGGSPARSDWTASSGLAIGYRPLGLTRHLNGTIRRLTYWPQRLPNSTLQNITL